MRVGNSLAIEYAEKNRGLLAVLALKASSVITSGPDDLHRVERLGTATRGRVDGDALNVEIRALHRVRLVKILQRVPFLLASFEQVGEPRTPVDPGLVFRLRLEATAVAKELVDVEYRNAVL